MNKAYRVTVQEQSYTEGRGPLVSPPQPMLDQIEADKRTGASLPDPETINLGTIHQPPSIASPGAYTPALPTSLLYS